MKLIDDKTANQEENSIGPEKRRTCFLKREREEIGCPCAEDKPYKKRAGQTERDRAGRKNLSRDLVTEKK